MQMELFVRNVMAVSMDFGVTKYMVLGLNQRPAEMLRHVGVSLVARVDVNMQLVLQVN